VPLLLPPALERSLDLLRCPACRTRPLRRDRAALPNRSHLRHRPVRLRQPPDRTARHQRGDPAMARARDRFLATGSYAPVRARRWRLAAAALPDRGAVGPVEARGPRPGSPSSAATSPNDPCLSRPEPRHGSRKEAEPEHMTAWSEPV